MVIPVAVVVSIVLIAVIGLSVWLSATAPEREMKKALETNDYYTVITAYENLRADGEFGLADDMIVNYINDVTDWLNNNFSLSVDTITEDDEIYEEIMWFLYENYDNMFVIVDEFFAYLYCVSELCRSNRSNAFYVRSFGCTLFCFRGNFNYGVCCQNIEIKSLL